MPKETLRVVCTCRRPKDIRRTAWRERSRNRNRNPTGTNRAFDEGVQERPLHGFAPTSDVESNRASRQEYLVPPPQVPWLAPRCAGLRRPRCPPRKRAAGAGSETSRVPFTAISIDPVTGTEASVRFISSSLCSGHSPMNFVVTCRFSMGLPGDLRGGPETAYE